MALYLKHRDSYDDYRFPIYIVESVMQEGIYKYIICHSADCNPPDTETKYRIKFDEMTCKVSNNVEDLADMIYVYNDLTGESKMYPACQYVQEAKKLYNKWYSQLRDKEIEVLHPIMLYYCVRTRHGLRFISQYDSRHDDYL